MNPSQDQTDRPRACDVLYPLGRRRTLRRPLGAVGKPASLVYELVSATIRRRRLSRRPAPWHDVTVVSIGNLEVGGSGKTPLAIHLIEYLERQGKKPVYLSRGFGGTPTAKVTVRASWVEGCCPVTVDGLRLLRGDAPMRAREIGDEGAMVAMRCPQTPLLFSNHKRRAIEVAREMFRPSHVILDDAFQSWDVPRHRDVVLLDAEHPFGNQRLLPAGTLRENAGALARADWIGINGCQATPPAGYDELVREACGRELPVFGIERQVVLVDPRREGPVERPAGVAALSSIARPRGFEEMLEDLTGAVDLAVRFPDHHRYRPRDIELIERALRRRDVTTLVTTEKDWVKLREVDMSFTRVLVACLKLTVDDAVLRGITKEPQATPAALS